MTAEIEVDALGLLCPLPILRVQQAAARAATGDVLVLWSDDERITADLPSWCEGNGHALRSLERQGHAWRGEVVVGGR